MQSHRDDFNHAGSHGQATRTPQRNRTSELAVLGITGNPTSGSDLRATKDAARILGLQLQVVEVGGAEEFGSAFSEITKGRSGGLLGLARADKVIR